MISNAHMMAILALIALLAALAVLCFFLARRARNLRKRMNEILEVLPIGVTVFDDTMRLRLFNTPYQNLFGSLGDKIERGMTYRDLISLTIDAGLIDLEGRSSDELKDFLVDHFRRGDGETAVRLASGRTFVAMTKRMADGWSVGTRRDITDGLWQAAEVTRIRDRLELVLNTARNGIVALNRDGEIVLSNPAADHMLGTSSGMLPCPWPDHVRFLNGLDLKPLDASLDPINRTLAGQALSEEINLMTRRDGAPARYVRVSSNIVSNTDGDVRAVVVLDDVTEAETSRQQIERSNRLDALGQLTGGIAHDFNNLLGTIMYAIELTALEPQNEKVTRILATAKNSVERGTNLTGRLLAFAKRQPGLEKSRRIADVIEELNTIVEPAIEESISLRLRADDPDLWVFCDQAQLDNALLNLILNARDAINRTGRSGTIRIASRGVSDLNRYERALSAPQPDEQFRAEPDVILAAGNDDASVSHRFIEISVTDDGQGMNDEVKRRAIDPFFSTKDMNTGTGLGLSMVYGFVKQSGGELRIYSEEGHGTTVRMLLPRGTPDGERESPVKRLPIESGAGETVLLVEDEEDLRGMMHDILVTLGYEVLVAKNGKDALRLVEDGSSFDLLLSDIVMPGGVGGFELAARLREMKPGIPVIYLSGYAGFTEAEMGEVVAPMVTKPCMPAELAVAIRGAFNQTSD